MSNFLVAAQIKRLVKVWELIEVPSQLSSMWVIDVAEDKDEVSENCGMVVKRKSLSRRNICNLNNLYRFASPEPSSDRQLMIDQFE
ncbi:hypothetical protein RCL_jg4593.t1 [Rhizophagus clarus]|uniref:Uncharacterized protein n=1 Tax=Rhizophagus clarus TaxID=94130 RepID=A0A8H3KUE6_9GLOM|nr:hypothetical protein RCL_jg4593.t1 [Rhizophagus clarus]